MSKALKIRDQDEASYAFENLETKGFLVIREFLSKQEVELLLSDYEEVKKLPGQDKNYDIRLARPEALKFAQKKLGALAAQVRAKSNVCVDHLVSGGYFATELGVDFAWHIDNQHYWLYQDFYNYLNMYIPIEKPVREKSNLSVVASDILKKRAPAMYKETFKKGAFNVQKVAGKDHLINVSSGEAFDVSHLPSLDEIGETPHLAAGDLLITRGDIFHKTQDASTMRVEASFRMVNSEGNITLNHINKMGAAKFAMMANNRTRFRNYLACFDLKDSDTIKIKDYISMDEAMRKQDKLQKDVNISTEAAFFNDKLRLRK